MSLAGRLVGMWRLLSYTETRPDGGSTDIFGPEPRGYLCYLADGRMMVMVGAAGRSRLKGAWDAIPAADKAANYDKIIAYAGRYTDLGERVRHHVEVCWIPNWEGKDLERLVIPAGEGRMILRTPAEERRPSHDLLWAKVE